MAVCFVNTVVLWKLNYGGGIYFLIFFLMNNKFYGVDIKIIFEFEGKLVFAYYKKVVVILNFIFFVSYMFEVSNIFGYIFDIRLNYRKWWERCDFKFYICELYVWSK